MKARNSFFIVLFLCLVVPRVSAADDEYRDCYWYSKFNRGITNTITSPLELMKQVHLTAHTESVPKSIYKGIPKGLYSFLVRLGAGVTDLLTFPFDFPTKDKSSLIDPEYLWYGWMEPYLENYEIE